MDILVSILGYHKPCNNEFGCVNISGKILSLLGTCLVWAYSFGYIASSIFSFLRNLQTDFYNDYTNLHCSQNCKRVPLFPQSCQHLSEFLDERHSDWDELESQSFTMHLSDDMG